MACHGVCASWCATVHAHHGASRRICTHTRTHARKHDHARMATHDHAHTHARPRTHARTHDHVHTHGHAHTHTRIGAHTRMHNHTCIRARILRRRGARQKADLEGLGSSRCARLVPSSPMASRVNMVDVFHSLRGGSSPISPISPISPNAQGSSF